MKKNYNSIHKANDDLDRLAVGENVYILNQLFCVSLIAGSKVLVRITQEEIIDIPRNKDRQFGNNNNSGGKGSSKCNLGLFEDWEIIK